MNKAKFMGQKSLLEAMRYAVEAGQRVKSARLFELAKEWYGKTTQDQVDHKFTLEFENVLDVLLGEGFRCTNKEWYRPGTVIEKKPHVPKGDERQLRMFG